MVFTVVGAILTIFGTIFLFSKKNEHDLFQFIGSGLNRWVFAPLCLCVGIFCLYTGGTSLVSGAAENPMPQLYLGLSLIAVGAVIFGGWMLFIKQKDATANMLLTTCGVFVLSFVGAGMILVGIILTVASLLVMLFGG